MIQNTQKCVWHLKPAFVRLWFLVTRPLLAASFISSQHAVWFNPFINLPEDKSYFWYTEFVDIAHVAPKWELPGEWLPFLPAGDTLLPT